MASLREENALQQEHIRASEAGAALAREQVIRQFREVERVLALLATENSLRKGILDAASQISIIYADLDGKVRLFNSGAEALLGYAVEEATGTLSIDRIHLPHELEAAGGMRGLAMAARRRQLPNREWTYVGRTGTLVPVMLSISPVAGQDGEIAGLMFAATDMTEAKAAEATLLRKNEELAALLDELRQAHQQLLQAEKMASLGQLAAGVAHEINNPIGFVNSNLSTLNNYAHKLLKLITAYESAEALLNAMPDTCAAINAAKVEADLDYLRDDVVALIAESRSGLGRVTKIVQDLRTFAHMGDTEWCWADLHEGIDSTLNVAWNELKYKATIQKHYGALPKVYCVPSQLNQVFMNLLVNAAQAIETTGTIIITTMQDDDYVTVAVTDTGKGIAREHLKKIFDPFFTTKPIGTGTGLGLYITFNIAKKHHGDIRVESEPGCGTTFTLRLPIHGEGMATAEYSERQQVHPDREI